MGQPYARQVGDLDARLRHVLADHVVESAWLPAVSGPESHFRNKAKLVVGGTRPAPTFGILDGDRQGVDLRECGLYEPGLHRALVALCEAVTSLGMAPYDVPSRSGELKHLVVTHAPTGELMVRFVLRSPGQIGRLRRSMPTLYAACAGLRVVSVNLQPEHKAVLAGPDELILTEQETLPMPVGDITLQLRPESFFQTNTAVAEQLYAQARDWVPGRGARTVWDLYCGVGGFGLSVASEAEVDVIGVEIEPGAVTGARRAATELMSRNPLASLDFRVGDAAAALRDEAAPDVVIVNPPRRGIGTLAEWLNGGAARQVIYSSCNVESLRADLERMPAYDVAAARAFDMFPQTHHHEVLVLLERRRRPPCG